MTAGKKAIGYIDLAADAFFSFCLTPFMGRKAWRGFPHTPEARSVLREWRRKRHARQ